MSHLFDLRQVLRGLSPNLINEFFRKRGVSIPPPGVNGRHTDLPHPLRQWPKLPQRVRNEAQIVLHDIHSLADHRGIKVMTEEIASRCPRRRDEFLGHTAYLDKAMWFYLNLPTAFEHATLFARADTLSIGRDAVRRDDFPKKSKAVQPKKVAALEMELRKYFWKEELRGQHCKVRHCRRGAGTDYLFAYLDDWPDRKLIFKDDGKMVRQNARFAFQVVFAYCAKDGSLEVIAKGAKVHLPLQQAFGKAVLGLKDVQPVDPTKPSYRLGMLLDPGFTYATEPADNIVKTRLVRIRLQPIGVGRDLEHLELKFRPHVSRQQWLEVINGVLATNRLTPETVLVKQATIQIVVAGAGDKRDTPITWNVSVPHTCNLKSRPDDIRLIGERCMAQWGMVNA